MGWWQVNADTLAGSRFVLSPLAETFAGLKLLHAGTAAHPGERAWLDAHLGWYRRRLAADPVTAALVRAGLGKAWIADFLTPTPTGEPEEFEAEVARVREASPEAARSHLAVALGGSPHALRGDPLPRILQDRDDLPARAADLLQYVWAEAVRPYWARRRRVLEADVVARTAQLSQGGWAAALDAMRPGMRWLGQNRLQVNLHEYPPREISGAELFFVPVTPQRHGWVSWKEPHRYAVVYPCSGALAGAEPSAAPESLNRLLGPAQWRTRSPQLPFEYEPVGGRHGLRTRLRRPPPEDPARRRARPAAAGGTIGALLSDSRRARFSSGQGEAVAGNCDTRGAKCHNFPQQPPHPPGPQP